jgi:hypothetical protein
MAESIELDLRDLVPAGRDPVDLDLVDLVADTPRTGPQILADEPATPPKPVLPKPRGLINLRAPQPVIREKPPEYGDLASYCSSRSSIRRGSART